MDCILSYSYRFTAESHKIPHTISFNNTYSTLFNGYSVSKPFNFTEKLVFLFTSLSKTHSELHDTSEWPAYGQQTGFVWLVCCDAECYCPISFQLWTVFIICLVHPEKGANVRRRGRRRADFFLRDGASEKTKGMKQVAR